MIFMIVRSSKPKKQRLFRYTAPMHMRQHFAHAHIDKALKAKLKLGKSAVQISKGDTVKVMSGSAKGKTGKVTRVDLSTGRIRIDSLVRKNSKGKELGVPISVSNVYITDLNLTDKARAAKLNVAQAKKEQNKKTEPSKQVQKEKAPAPAGEVQKTAPAVAAKE